MHFCQCGWYVETNICMQKIIKQNIFSFFFLSPIFSGQTNRILTTISEQSQLLSPKKLLALQRQTSLYSPLPPRSPGNSYENISFAGSTADLSCKGSSPVAPNMSVGIFIPSFIVACFIQGDIPRSLRRN